MGVEEEMLEERQAWLEDGASFADDLGDARVAPRRSFSWRSVLGRAGLAAIGSGAALLALCRPSGGPGVQGDLAIEGKWSRFDVHPCPPPMHYTGGSYHTPAYISVATAWVCLDKNGDHMLTVDELGPGAVLTDVTYPQFYETLRKLRYSMLISLPGGIPEEAVHVHGWTENLLERLPMHTESPVRQKWAGQVPAAMDPTRGIVQELFTFGAPAVVKGGMLANKAQADGCFRGLRVYTKGTVKVKDFGIRLEAADPIASLLTAFGFSHPRSDVLSVDDDLPLEAGYTVCADGWNGPKADLWFWFDGHTSAKYAYEVSELAKLLTDGSWKLNVSDARAALPPGDFDTGVGYKIGDYVLLRSDEAFVKNEFRQVIYTWDDAMRPMLGEVFPVIRVPSPSVVALPSVDGANGGVWYFPVAAVEGVSEEVAAKYRGTKQPVLKDTWLASAGGVESAANHEKRLGVEQAAQLQALAHIAYLREPTDQFIDAQDYDFHLINHASDRKTAQPVDVMASLFQQPLTNDCVVAFAVISARNIDDIVAVQSNGIAPFFKQNPTMATNLFAWWSMLAGDKPKFRNPWGPNAPETFDYKVSEPRWTNVTSDCTVRRQGGLKPCRDPKVAEQLEGISEVTQTAAFCGIPGVQKYIADHLRRFIHTDIYKDTVRTGLPGCNSVRATGHDLGGALATLWAACINSGLKPGDAGYEDYANASWTNGRTVTLPRFQPSWNKEGAFMLRNRLTGKIVELQGHSDLLEKGEGELVLGTPTTEGSEQRWAFTPEGFLKNENSTKCLGVQGYLGGASSPDVGIGRKVAVGDCNDGVKSTDQAWNFTKHGFLLNQYTGLCLSATLDLVECPMSTQIWNMRTDGFIVHQVTGHCLDVEGSPGTSNGARLVLWPCEFDLPDTDQRWEVIPGGLLRNKLSKRCIDTKDIHGLYTRQTLQLWDCIASEAVPSAQRFAITPLGFLESMAVGRCVNVASEADGSVLKLDVCEKYHALQTAHRWERMVNGFVVNRGFPAMYRDKCLSETNGGSVALKRCTSRARQQWVVSPGGRIEPSMSIGKCIGNKNDTFNVYTCARAEDKKVSQKWQLTRDGFLMNLESRKCIDVGADGKHIGEFFCHFSDQRWKMKGRHIESQLSGKCIDVRGGTPVEWNRRPELILWTCESSENGTDQTWQWHSNGSIVNTLSRKCVDIDGNSSTKYQDGAKLVLDTCDPGSLSQRWRLTPTGAFKSYINDTQCVDVVGPAAAANGRGLVIYTCDSRRNFTDQTWDLIGENGAVLAAQKALKMFDAPLRPAFPPEDDATAEAERIAEGPGVEALAKSAGAFVTAGEHVWWVYKGYKHLVPPLNDCSACHCKHNFVVMPPDQIAALVTAVNYDCTLQSVANVVEGFKSEGDIMVTSAAALSALPTVGRFLSAGQDVYWEYNGRKHLVPPGIGCHKCGCQARIEPVVQLELDSFPDGRGFDCALQYLASYGVDVAGASYAR